MDSSKKISYCKLLEFGRTFTVQPHSNQLTCINDVLKKKEKTSVHDGWWSCGITFLVLL